MIKWLHTFKQQSLTRKFFLFFILFIIILLGSRSSLLIRRVIVWNQHQLSLFALRDVSDTSRLEADIRRLNSEYNSLSHLFFDYTQLRYFALQELPDLISESGMRLEKIVFEKDEILLEGLKDKGAFMVHPIQLYLKGNYSDVMAFIQTVENYSLITRVSEISLAPESDLATTLTVRLRLSCYGLNL
jgi:hypothetical protein